MTLKELGENNRRIGQTTNDACRRAVPVIAKFISASQGDKETQNRRRYLQVMQNIVAAGKGIRSGFEGRKHTTN